MSAQKSSRRSNDGAVIPQTVVVKTPTDWWLAGPSLVAVLFSIGLGIYTMRSTGKQLKISRDQTDEARRADATEERPWLAVTAGKVDPGQMPGAVIHVKNTGKTPALDVYSQFWLAKTFKYDDHMPLRRDQILNNGLQRSILAPGEEEDIKDFSFSGAGLPSELGKNVADNMRSFAHGSARFNGAVVYTDINGTQGFTRFCFILNEGVTALRCPIDNDMQ